MALTLKDLVFFRAKTELDSYQMMTNSGGYTEAEIETQRDRFCAVYQVIEEAELETEYEAWKQKALKGEKV